MCALIKENKIEQAIDVHAEFREQLAFAKQLRSAAQEYLSNANDPFKLAVTPKAHEIEVTYFDHNDMEMRGEIMFPKKKIAQLNVILESVYADGNLEPDKYKITTVDIRKFALDAINTTDTCIDKFAKLGGAYQQDRPNDAVVSKAIAETLASFVEFAKELPDMPLDEKVNLYQQKHNLTDEAAIGLKFLAIAYKVMELPGTM